eukprot:Phypoly_transcript_18876.p1 GENE.Phypoly_transcript_18876~~Phypoly_transcript_18876.p1  ORF type:complete len:243 (+),score=36.22 Phypoly_transcript_18876:62-730(+)
MAFIRLLLCILALTTLTLSADPTKPTWPDEFQIPFGLNWGIIAHNASAMMYYNYDQAQAQLLDYEVHCFPLVKYDSIEYPCQMWFNNKGIFVAIPSLDIPCCMFQQGVGVVPPTFLQGFNYSGYNDTVPDMYGVEHESYQWDGVFHFKYWTDVNTGDDVQFQDGPTGVTWSFGKMDVTPQNVSIFDIPNTSACSSKCSFLDQKIFYSPEEIAIPFYRVNFKD